ncbi:tape measure protein [Stutzerimonas stutzeri]|uniref:tape measure protein n=1 Tax=Stutzerimonas stutzeri TaxID=316 RepID=UPI002659C624|nr:tape measure protein [Stutzerimonas stutzeri]MCF6782928.1 tape measure protein [Stutzerimonas stutzeri]MCF6804039.1 tape measure protein [Stutzerimonas stutzeri]
MAAISSFYAQIGIQTRLQDLRSVDRYLKILEGKVRKSTITLQKDFVKNLKLPTLKVKKVQIDNPLAAQRNIQTELNRIGRLTEIRVGSVKLDEARITRQVQNVFTRAASAARLNLRTIQGSSGGASLHYPMQLPYVPRVGSMPPPTPHIPYKGYAPTMPYMPSTQGLGRYAAAAGIGGGLGASLPMIGGPAGLAVAGVAAAGYMGYRQVDKLNQSQTKREAQRIALDVASGSQDREGRDAMNSRFLDLSNRLGLNAEKNVDAYAQAMKQLQGAGLSAPQAFKLFENVSIATKGSGLTDEQNSRQLYAITQTFGKQALMSEELNQQLGDANAGIKRFVQEVWSDKTGKSGMEAFLKDMSNRMVTPDMLAEAYARQAAYVAPRVEEFAASAESSKNRLANARFTEELQRTVDGEMVPSIKKFTAAQQELHQATAPLRDGMYSLGAATLSATAGLVSWGAKLTTNFNQSPAMQKQASYEQRSEAVMGSSMGRGLLNIPNITRLREQPRKLTTPQLYQKPEWRMQADQYANPESILEQLFSTTNNVNVQSSVSFQPGSFQIQTQATDAKTLAAELQPLIREQFDSSLQITLQEVDTSFGSK